jgi:hypothetical protein
VAYDGRSDVLCSHGPRQDNHKLRTLVKAGIRRSNELAGEREELQKDLKALKEQLGRWQEDAREIAR